MTPTIIPKSEDANGVCIFFFSDILLIETGAVAETESDNSELIGRVIDDMDPALLAFLHSHLNTFLKWDLVRFFHDNPHTTDSADNIATYTGRDAIAIANELNELARDGVLVIHHLGDTQLYTLTEGKPMRALIAHFVQACADQKFRMRAVYQVIKGMR